MFCQSRLDCPYPLQVGQVTKKYIPDEPQLLGQGYNQKNNGRP